VPEKAFPPSASATDEAGATPVDAPKELTTSSRSFLKATQRELTAEEAASPAGVRWLMHDAERLEAECGKLQDTLEGLRVEHDKLKEVYQNKRVELEQVRAGSKVTSQIEKLSSLSIAGGSAGIGASIKYLNDPTDHSFALVVLVISAMFVLGGVVLRKWS
jgi:hypothetical protein